MKVKTNASFSFKGFASGDTYCGGGRYLLAHGLGFGICAIKANVSMLPVRIELWNVTWVGILSDHI